MGCRICRCDCFSDCGGYVVVDVGGHVVVGVDNDLFLLILSML